MNDVSVTGAWLMTTILPTARRQGRAMIRLNTSAPW